MTTVSGMQGGPRRRSALRRAQLAMTPAEVDEFLATERTCRVATVDAEGQPHVSPLWFVWDGAVIWLCTLVRSRRFADVRRNPRVSLVVDAGDEYEELRGVELRGTAEVVGPVPWDGVVTEELAEPDRLFTEKYPRQRNVRRKGRHAWLRVVPHTISSWDFRKGRGR